VKLEDVLPTKKVTAGLLGGAMAVAVLWLLVDVFGVLDVWPEAWIVGAWTIIFGFVLAWFIPEGRWADAEKDFGVDD